MASSLSSSTPNTSDIFNSIAQASTTSTSSSSSSGSSSSTASSGTDNGNILAAAAGSAQQASQLFLSLLTTQLQNQDPENPMDSNQFVQQLVELTQVGTGLNTNQLLQQLVNQNQNTALTPSLSYIGTQVTATNSTTSLTNGTATWTLQNPSSNPVAASITIKNAAGATVFTGNAALQSGSQVYNWNGLNSNGVVQPAGNYTISVNAQDSTGSVVNVSAITQGTVTGVENSNGNIVLMVGNVPVNQSNVIQVTAPGSAASTTAN